MMNLCVQCGTMLLASPPVAIRAAGEPSSRSMRSARPSSIDAVPYTNPDCMETTEFLPMTEAGSSIPTWGSSAVCEVSASSISRVPAQITQPAKFDF